MAVFVIGAGGHAKVVADLIDLRGLGVLGFVDDTSPYRRGEPFAGGVVIGTFADLLRVANEVPITDRLAVVAVGDCQARLDLGSRLELANFELVSLVHPSAVVSRSATLGKGTVVCANAYIGPDCQVGKQVIVNSGASVDHDCTLADGVHVGPGALLGGWCTVGESTFLGIGATCKDRIQVGRKVTVGAGAVVVRDIPDCAVAYGNPAKVKRYVDDQQA